MDLIWARDGVWQGVVKDYTSFDAAFGDDENNFTLTLPADGCEITVSDEVLYPHTEYGGVVDGMQIDTTGEYDVIVLSGRTWHGVMAASIVKPDVGQDYLVLSGSVEDCVRTLIDRQGLAGTMSAVPGDEAQVSYRCSRYADMYSVLKGMLASVGMVPAIRRTQGTCEIAGVMRRDITGVDDNYVPFKMSSSKPVNHLVCLGEGELKDRVVVDLYMDGDGHVSRVQTFHGIDEIAEVYDYTSASEEDLIENGTERLQGYYADMYSIDTEIPDNVVARVGDTVTGTYVKTGATITAEIAVVTVEGAYNKEPEVSYKVGSAVFRIGA